RRRHTRFSRDWSSDVCSPDLHEKRFDGRKASAHTGMGFNAMWTVLKDILPAAGSMDTQAIREAALALDKPIGSTIVGWGVKFDRPEERRVGEERRRWRLVCTA